MPRGSEVISIVDDDLSVRRALRRLVGSAGYQVETFASAEDFLASEQLKQTACLILDIQMPGLNGLMQRNPLPNGTFVGFVPYVNMPKLVG